MPKSLFGAALVLGGLAVGLAGCGDSEANAARLKEISSLQQKLASLETEATRLEDIKAIKILQRAYGYYVDQNLWSEVVDLFTDDGSLEIARNGVYAGKDHIRQYLLRRGQEGLIEGEINEHIILQPVITVSEDGLSAKARWRALIIKGQYKKDATWAEGPYENEYVKENGVWKIKSLHWYQTYIVPFEGGWAKNKDVTGGRTMRADFPPDRPTTHDYEVWPGVYTPPFHYKNPVTGRE